MNLIRRSQPDVLNETERIVKDSSEQSREARPLAPRSPFARFLFGLIRAHRVDRVLVCVHNSAKCNFLKFAPTSCEISRNPAVDLLHEISPNFRKFHEITANYAKFHLFGRFPFSVPPPTASLASRFSFSALQSSKLLSRCEDFGQWSASVPGRSIVRSFTGSDYSDAFLGSGIVATGTVALLGCGFAALRPSRLCGLLDVRNLFAAPLLFSSLRSFEHSTLHRLCPILLKP